MVMYDESVEGFFSNKSKTRFLRKDTWVKNDMILASGLVDHWNSNICQHIEEKCHDFQGGNIRSHIPKIIHFIWLGSNPIPQFPMFCEEYKKENNNSDMNEAMNSWRKHHKEWKIHLWNDADILDLFSRYECNQYLSAKNLYKEAMHAQNYGMASDIARIFVLYFIGGVYVDIDYICNKSVDLLHNTFEFYCGASNVGCVEINNGIIGSIRGHWILGTMMDEISSCHAILTSTPVSNLISDFLDRKSILSMQGASSVLQFSDMDVIDRTGPGMFTRSLLNIFASKKDALRLNKIAVLPACSFHPMPNSDRLQNDKDDFSSVMLYLKSSSFAVHLWSCSWQS
jgi:hypothetical protein